ncbi:MAG: glycine cleavage system protein GcvH [Acidobacteria bacterium]|nr:glycine cleavage system protein GcvH [Acidobacteriota bacterium]
MSQSNYPAQFRYSTEHEWVDAPGPTAATVGITDHAQHALGDIVFVDLPRVGTAVEAGKPCGSVESVKAVSEIFSPVTGEVTEVNATLADHPEIVNQDPHVKGWMIKVALAAGGVPSELMTVEQYQELLKREGS